MKIKNSGYLSKGNICFTFGTFWCVYDIKYGFFILWYMFIVFTTITQQGLAEEIFTCFKPYTNMQLLAFFYHNLFIKHNIYHFVIYFSDGKISSFFRPFIISYFDRINTCKILFHSYRINLIYTKSSKFYITFRNKAYGIIAFFVCNITKHTFWRIDLFQPIEYLWWIHSSF